MSRYLGPKWKVSRRLGFSILENGKEFALGKNGKERRNYAPGMHGLKRGKKSEYGLQLQEKQRVRYTFGLSEKQLRKVFDKAQNMPGPHGDNFMILLETRLDNIVYRIGFASTRKQARQLVTHGHVLVNQKKLNIPSAFVVPGQTISLKEKSQKLDLVKNSLDQTLSRKAFLEFDEKKLIGKLIRLPERSECLEGIQDSFIVEFYNR